MRKIDPSPRLANRAAALAARCNGEAILLLFKIIGNRLAVDTLDGGKERGRAVYIEEKQKVYGR